MAKRSWMVVGLVLALPYGACRSQESERSPQHVVQPAPAEPAAPSPPAAEPAPPAEPKPPPPESVAQPTDTPRARPSERPEPAAKPSAAKPRASEPASRPRTKPSAPPPVPAEPIAQAEPPPPEPAPAPAKPATKVLIPNTARVRVEVPPGLQSWLDKDTRMQPWLGKVMKVIDACYADVVASNPSASGTISFRVTMHQNARPTPDIQALPGELSGVVACATGQLMRTRMPLFTGTEGEQYVVRVKFGN